jgi:hypothetical protein
MRSSLVVRIFVFLAVVAVLAIAISRVTSRSAVSYSAAATVSIPRLESIQRQDPPEIIDGARNPEKIPDRLAYTLLFRFLSNRKTEIEKNTARTYLRMIFGCDVCPDSTGTKQQRVAAHANITKFLKIAEEFESQIQTLDRDARETRGPGQQFLNDTARGKLKKLDADKGELVKRTMAVIKSRLGPEGSQRLHDYLLGPFKRRIKIHPGNLNTAFPPAQAFNAKG